MNEPNTASSVMSIISIVVHISLIVWTIRQIMWIRAATVQMPRRDSWSARRAYRRRGYVPSEIALWFSKTTELEPAWYRSFERDLLKSR